MDPIRVLLADDHTLFRRGIRTLLERLEGIEVVAEAADGMEAIDCARDLVPDVILMDIKMPGIDGVSATKSIVKENPHIGVILVTMFDDPELVFAGMRAGASGYVLKEADPDELRRAIEAGARGEILLCPIIAARVLQSFDVKAEPEVPGVDYQELTPRELEVLQQAAEGLSNKEIAAQLTISEKTAKNHIANIFSKLQVNDRTQAVVYALREGLVSIGHKDSGAQ